MENVPLSRVYCRTCPVYVDDVIVVLKLLRRNSEDVDMVHGALLKAGVTLNVEKCCIFPDSVDYSGHVIKPEALVINNAPIKRFSQLSLLGIGQSYLQLLSCVVLTDVVTQTILTSLLRWKKILRESHPKTFQLLLIRRAKQLLHCRKSVLPDWYTPSHVFTYHSSLTETRAATKYKLHTLRSADKENVSPSDYGYGHQARKKNSVAEKQCLDVVWPVWNVRLYKQRAYFAMYIDQALL